MVMTAPRRSAVAEAVAAYLFSHRWAPVPVAELAEACAASPRAVKWAVARLRREGLTIRSGHDGYQLCDLPRGSLVACPRCGRAMGRPHAGIAGRWVCRSCGWADDAEPASWAPLVAAVSPRTCGYCGGEIRRAGAARAVRDARHGMAYCSVGCAVAAGGRRRRKGETACDDDD